MKGAGASGLFFLGKTGTGTLGVGRRRIPTVQSRLPEGGKETDGEVAERLRNFFSRLIEKDLGVHWEVACMSLTLCLVGGSGSVLIISGVFIASQCGRFRRHLLLSKALRR
jgi:hypothetical protein